MELATTNPHTFELPTEILCIIFWLACGPSPFENGAEHLPAYTEVPISHVCRRWRSTSLNYPKLWTTIIYDIRLRKMRRHQVVDHLKTYIRRAAGHPLDVRFASLQLYDEDNVYLMLELLLGNSSTWHRISLTLPFYIFETKLIDRLRDTHAPLLESYEIEVCGYHPSSYLPNPPSTPILSLGSPRLTHLSFRTLVFPWSIPCSPNLTTIHIEALKYTYTRTAFFSILRLPSLTTLSVGRVTFLDIFDVTSGVEPIIAHELVQFRCSAVAVARCIWYFVRAPKLDILVLEGIPINSCLFPPAALSAADSGDGVANIFPSVRTVVILDCEVQGGIRTDAKDLASATRSVTNLLVSSADPSNSIFSSILYYHQQGAQLWPNLEFIALNLFETQRFFQPSQIMDFLISRSGLHHPRLKMILSEDVASTWKDEDPISWSTFLESGHYNQASPDRAIADIAHSFNPDGIFHQPPDHLDPNRY